MIRKLELLAPGGDLEAVKAAIVGGANAVYCGLDIFNARNRASNLSMDELHIAIKLAHEYNCEIFLTLNVVILESEIPVLTKVLNQIVNSGIDGIIVQDLGVFNIVRKYFPSLDIHASTQMTTHNDGQIEFLSKIGASRVNLSRELNLTEIKSLTALAHKHEILTEVFVHGALCIAFSGQCYSSSVSVGNSGNRGRCSQACRDEYEETAAGNKYPLNLKDNSAYFNLPELVDAKVDSLKVEGRIKGAHYVYTVVDTWRKQIDSFIQSGQLIGDDSNLHKVFNRSFTNSFLTGKLSKDMFIDSPRDYGIKHAISSKNAVDKQDVAEVKQELYDDRKTLGVSLSEKIKSLNTDTKTIQLVFSGKLGTSLCLSVTSEESSYTFTSNSKLMAAEGSAITETILEKRFKSLGSATQTLLPIDTQSLAPNLSIPFKELGDIKKKVSFELNGKKALIPPATVPILLKHPKVEERPLLSILISDENDSSLSEITNAEFHFKLPESLKKGCDKHIDLLLRNSNFIPWFPAVLIGKDYAESVRILEQVKPRKIVTNNTGIAMKAFEMGIEWVAGPFLNTTNSHALVTLKEELNCSGAFISNEINRNQIRNITRPENFKLMYSIYHPILMMTSRQCFFQRTVGCKKKAIEDNCMLSCTKATTITNVKGISFAVDKQKGGYPSIYNHEQFLNLEAVKDFSGLFDEFFIDLTDIGSGSKEKLDKRLLIKEFEKILASPDTTHENLNQMVSISTNAQYQQGL